MISKTDFLWYLDAPMHLWARVHNQLEKITTTEYEQFLMQQGQQVEFLAKQYIEQILLPEYSNAKLFWQPTLDDGRFEMRADALIFDRDANAYDLYEIKSSTSVKTNHEYDLTFQVLLLESIFDLRLTHILHIDKTYQRGSEFDIERFFIVEEISDKVTKRREDVDIWREEAWSVAQRDLPLPSLACTKPKSCPCPSLCHPDLPENPIYNIPYIGKKAKQLQEMGVKAIEEIPESFNLNIKQQKHYQAVKFRQPIIDKSAIRQQIAALEYPLNFLDYETFNPAVPLFRDYHPYEHIVFQYSLYVISKPDSEPDHFECLITESCDPAPMLVPHLLNNISPDGSVIVWNKHFEACRNNDMAAHCPEYAEELLKINNQLYDLMLIFKEGHYVHPNFKGSASLKAVLPVICPELIYDELKISKGDEAMLAWYRLQTEKISDDERIEIVDAMRAYCKMDTYAMIAILNQLRKL